MAKDQGPESFAQIALPHLDVAYNLARWLTRDDHLAEDVVQEAYLRAFRFFSSFRGGDGKAWLLTIVRNTWFARFSKVGSADRHTVLDEMQENRPDEQLDPEALVIQRQAVERVRRAIRSCRWIFAR